MRTLPKMMSQKPANTAQRKMAQQRPEQANVVVTDPISELAVVLRYDPAIMDAPIVVDQYESYSLQEIQALADQGANIIESTLLAIVLYENYGIGQAIPEDLYSDMAAILSSVYQLNEIVERITIGLEGDSSQQSSYARTRERHSDSPTFARSGIRVSLD